MSWNVFSLKKKREVGKHTVRKGRVGKGEIFGYVLGGGKLGGGRAANDVKRRTFLMNQVMVPLFPVPFQKP
jgi:hypothetical protein